MDLQSILTKYHEDKKTYGLRINECVTGASKLKQLEEKRTELENAMKMDLEKFKAFSKQLFSITEALSEMSQNNEQLGQEIEGIKSTLTELQLKTIDLGKGIRDEFKSVIESLQDGMAYDFETDFQLQFKKTRPRRKSTTSKAKSTISSSNQTLIVATGSTPQTPNGEYSPPTLMQSGSPPVTRKPATEKTSTVNDIDIVLEQIHKNTAKSSSKGSTKSGPTKRIRRENDASSPGGKSMSLIASTLPVAIINPMVSQLYKNRKEGVVISKIKPFGKY